MDYTLSSPIEFDASTIPITGMVIGMVKQVNKLSAPTEW